MAFHWSFQTLTTVGYGDISAHNWWEYIFACSWMIFGVGFYGYMFGTLIQIIEKSDEDNEALDARI